MNKTALIFGITGQDGSYLSELLLNNGYTVHGIARRVSVDTTERINHLLDNPNLILHIGDITDSFFVLDIINKLKPDECYNLAAMSHVGISFHNPITTFDVDCNGCLYILEAIRQCSPTTRFVQMSTSEMYGDNYKVDDGYPYQDETVAFSPNSPYAAAKLAAHNLIRIYRNSYNIFASSALCFNHESPRRGDNFVTRKITRYVAMLYCLSQLPTKYHTELDMMKERMEVSVNHVTKNGIPKLRLGNLDAFRDWGHAKDYMNGVYMTLQHQKPDDFIFATNKTYSVRQFLERAFSYIDANYKDYIIIDPEFYRPCEVEYLCGSYNKAEKELGWSPVISFQDLVHEMITTDINHFLNKINYNAEKIKQEIRRPSL